MAIWKKDEIIGDSWPLTEFEENTEDFFKKKISDAEDN